MCLSLMNFINETIFLEENCVSDNAFAFEKYFSETQLTVERIRLLAGSYSPKRL